MSPPKRKSTNHMLGFLFGPRGGEDSLFLVTLVEYSRWLLPKLFLRISLFEQDLGSLLDLLTSPIWPCICHYCIPFSPSLLLSF